MKIKFPISNELFVENGSPAKHEISIDKSIVLVGANGAGKTRLGVWVEQHNEMVHRISAQKSLNMPKQVDVGDRAFAQNELLLGNGNAYGVNSWHFNKNSYRWGSEPVTFLQNDYARLLKFLLADKSQVSIKFCEMSDKGYKDYPHTALIDKVKSIWDSVIKHKELIINNGSIRVRNSLDGDKTKVGNSDDEYSGAQLSDGERAVFYYIGEAVSAKPGSLIIVDEPENNLHKAILVNLWNKIENVCDQCRFMYITHDLDFALSRNRSTLIWVKKMPELNCWGFEEIKDKTKLNSLYLEIAGSRQKVILVEGTSNRSYDNKLYSVLYPDYNVIPVDNCGKVIDAVKAANTELWNLHHVEVMGIIDRDRRGDNEISKYRANNIFVLKVAELENLFLLPEVIRFMCKDAHKNDNDTEKIITQTKREVFKHMEDNEDKQIVEYLKWQMINELNSEINKSKDLSALSKAVNCISEEKIQKWIHDREKLFKDIQDKKDYEAALQLINNKGLLKVSGLPAKLGFNVTSYRDWIIGAINSFQKNESGLNPEEKYRNVRIGKLIEFLKSEIGIM